MPIDVFGELTEFERRWIDANIPWKALENLPKVMRAWYERVARERAWRHTGEMQRGDYGVMRMVHVTATVAETATLFGNCCIGPGCYVGPGAVVHDSLLAEQSKVGENSIVRRSWLLPRACAAHLNYVGDSIVGRGANLGGGTITANLRHDGRNIRIREGEVVHETGQRKLGAIIGDDVHLGCNVVLNPGTVLGRGSSVDAGIVLRPGVFPPRSRIRQSYDYIVEQND